MKGIIKKVQKFVAIAVLAAFAMVTGVSAAESRPVQEGNAVTYRYTAGTVDTTLKPSLTIYKYSYAGNAAIKGNGLPVQDVPSGVTPMKDVVFKYLKVGSLQMGSRLAENGAASANGVGLVYQMENNAVTEALGVAGRKCSSDELETALAGVSNKRALEKTLSGTEGNVSMDPTGADGRTSKSEMEQGLYLVIEYAAPASVVEKTDPFFVSLPMTNVGTVNFENKPYNPGELWQYDVYVYPKNEEEFPDIEKNVVNSQTGTEEKYTSASVGESVTFKIRVALPEHAGSMKKLDVVDTLAKGLTFGEVSEMTVGGTQIDRGSMPVADVKNKVETGEKIITWSFMGGDRNCISGHEKEELVITYTAALNENCIVGSMGNANGVELVYNYGQSVEGSNVPDEVIKHETKSRVYTFGIDITKVDSSGEKLPGVKFELYEDEALTTKINLTQKAAEGATEEVKSYYANEEGNAVIETDANGRAWIWGLKPGTYYLKETATAAGYTLLNKPIKVTIGSTTAYQTAPDGEKGTYGNSSHIGNTYYKLVAGNYVPITLTEQSLNFGKSDIYVKSGETYTKLQDSLTYAVLRAKADEGEGFTDNGTSVLLKVINNKPFVLPLTGGMGSYMFILCGAAIILATAGLIFIRRKRSAVR